MRRLNVEYIKDNKYNQECGLTYEEAEKFIADNNLIKIENDTGSIENDNEAVITENA
jgi:hypothetical protein